jgi:hypothetical protein
MEIKTYQFNLYDAQDGSLVMGTEVDEIPEPKIDAEFWQRFLRGDCAMIFMGEKTEKIDDELSSGPTSIDNLILSVPLRIELSKYVSDYINEEILRGKRDIARLWLRTRSMPLLGAQMSIFSYPDRGPWGRSSWRGNCTGHIYKELLTRLQPRFFVGPMMGSGASIEVAKHLGIVAVGWICTMASMF